MSNKPAIKKPAKKVKIPKIEVLFEDKDIVALNKPAGLMVHSDGRNKGPFLTDWILESYPQAAKVGEPMRDEDGNDLERPGIVHRLDRGTSGVILVAKTKKGFECLKKQFQDKEIRKRYIAFVWGALKEEFGTINRPIGRSGSDFRKWSAERGARGEMREAETYWTRLASLEIPVEDSKTGLSPMEKFTLVEAEPKTGRTHQIRVHFLALQHPVVGDDLYAPKKPMVLGFKRLALHAKSIKFKDCAGNMHKVESPWPKDFAAAIKMAGIELKA